MTCLNLWIEDDHALLAVDTATMALATSEHGRTFHSSKFALLPHAGVALAFSGWSGLFQQLMHQAGLESDLHDYDSARGCLGRLADFSMRHQLQLVAGLPEEQRRVMLAAIDRQELLLVGWSERAQRVEATRFTQTSTDRGFEASTIDGQFFVSPWDDVHCALPAGPFDTPGAMQALMQRQVAFALRHRSHLAAAFGGNILTAEITRESIQIRRRPLAG